MSKHKTYLVSEYMRREVNTVRSDATLKEAITMMIKRKTNGLVVIDAEGNIVGMLSSWDVLKHLVPKYLKEDTHLASFAAADLFVERVHASEHDPVSEYMTTMVRVVSETSTMMKAMTLMSEYHIRQLPVVDESQRLVGYINRTDIKRAVGEILGVV